MATGYPNFKTFVGDEVKPPIVNLRDFLNARIDKLRAEHEAALQELNDDLTAHINNHNNPHVTRPNHIFTIASFPPTNAQGSIGDIWVEYLPQTL
jgi:hypothetical protein